LLHANVVIDAVQMQRRARGHLVDDLGNSRPVIGVVDVCAVVALDSQAARKVSGGDRIGETGETSIDDRDVDPAAVEARVLPRSPP
jgi:hypothetical protein